MENVGSRRIVDNDDFLEFAAKATEVLDVVAAVEDARFAEEARAEHAPLVEQIGHRIGVLGQAGGEQDALVQLAHLTQKLVHVRPLQYVHLVHCAVDFNWHDEVGVADRLQITIQFESKVFTDLTHSFKNHKEI